VLLGRTFEEYRRYFLLKPDDLVGKESWMWQAGSVPLRRGKQAWNKGDFVRSNYSLPPEKYRTLRARLESVYHAIGSVPTYRWGYYKSRIHARIAQTRISYLSLGFTTHPERYVAGELREYRLRTVSLI